MSRSLKNTLLAVAVSLGLSHSALAHGTFDVSAYSQAKITSITGSTDYSITAEVIIEDDVTRTYKTAIGAATSNYVNDLGIVGDENDMEVGDYLWIDTNVYGEVDGAFGTATAGTEIDAEFFVTNNSLTESLFVTLEYSNNWLLDVGFHAPYQATGRVWLNFHSHGAVNDAGSYNQIFTAEGSNSYLANFTREIAPGTTANLHFYNNVSGTATVPEAGSLTLAGLAVIGGAAAFIRKRRKV